MSWCEPRGRHVAAATRRAAATLEVAMTTRAAKATLALGCYPSTTMETSSHLSSIAIRERDRQMTFCGLL